jgi:hypothetical protein
MSRLFLSWVFGLLFTIGAYCQPLWELTIDPASQYELATSALYNSEGRLFISLCEFGPPYSPGRVFEVSDQTGTVLASSILDLPGRISPYAFMLGENGDGDLLGYSPAYIQDPGDGDSARMAFWRFGTDLEQLDVKLIGKPGKDISFNAGFIAPDSTVRVVYTTDDWAGNLHQLEALKLTLGGDSVTGKQIYNGMSQGAATSLAMHPNGRMVMGSAYADWGYTPTSGGNATYLNGDFSIDSTYYLAPVDANSAAPLFDAPMHPIQVLPLPSGNLLISGQFWRDFGTDHPAVIQHTDAQAHVIDQYVHDSPWEDDYPAIVRAMDMAGDGSLYFAQMNNWNGNAGIYSPFPSQVEVTHLDTSLNVLGRYVFDGFADSIFYLPYYVLSTPDGGVLVMGMKRELALPGLPAKAWIAKLGPENFTGIKEDHRLVLSLWPNPGADGFNLSLKERVEQGRVQLHDMQGRLVLDRAVDGINIYVPTPGLGAGLYAATLRDRNGKILQHLRWAKN